MQNNKRSTMSHILAKHASIQAMLAAIIEEIEDIFE
jgi:hypothetical protein